MADIHDDQDGESVRSDNDPSEEVMDIDEVVEDTYGNKPKAGVPFTVADEMAQDEDDRRDMPEDEGEEEAD